MNSIKICVSLVFGLIWTTFLLSTLAHEEGVNDESSMRHFCYAPGTPVDRMIKLPPHSQHTERFNVLARWTVTASNPSPIETGSRITLLWSIVPDGTQIVDGTETLSSDVRAFLGELFGNVNIARDKIQEAFDRWGELIGVTYQYVEENGSEPCPISPFGSTNCPGQVGVRGDVRIGGTDIDGDNNVLGYNYYPNNGDMVLDTNDIWYENNKNTTAFLNVISHEHGHGLGLGHVCPISGSKLMEPTVSNQFDGPQHDDIRGGQVVYGDSYENNENIATATPLGSFVGPLTRRRILPIEWDRPVSVETTGTSDIDFYSFSIDEDDRVIIYLSNYGEEYEMTAQPQSASCGETCPCETVNSGTRLDLNMQLFSSSSELLETASSGDTRNGASEYIEMDLEAGTYYLRIYPGGGGSDREQMYVVRLTIGDGLTTTTANVLPRLLDGGAASTLSPFWL